MSESITWSIWKDDKSVINLTCGDLPKNILPIETFNSFLEAKIAWKFYYDFLIDKHKINKIQQ